MLYKYKNDYEKIAMGLLSFIPDLKEISHLKSCFEWYRAEDVRHLYLWKNENGDFIAIAGIEVDDASKLVMLRHISVTPAERNHGVCFKVMDALSRLYPDYELMGSLETAGLLSKWENQNGVADGNK